MTEIKVGFVRDNTIISRLIRWFGKLQTGAARFSHVFFIIEDNEFHRAPRGRIKQQCDGRYTIEALWQGLRSQDFCKAYKGKEILVYKLACLTPRQHQELKVMLNTDLGKFKGIYGYLNLPFMALDSISSWIVHRPIFWFTQRIKTRWFPICSRHIGFYLYKFGLEKFKEWRSLSPDFQDDIMRADFQSFPIDYELTTYKE